MTYDDMVAVHINRDGMVTGVPWHRNWRWRWDCRGEGWHANIGMRIPQHFVLMGKLPAAYGYQAVHHLNVCMPLSTASTVCMLKKTQHLQEILVHPVIAILFYLDHIHHNMFSLRKPLDSKCHILFTQQLVYTNLSLSPALFKVQALCHSDNSSIYHHMLARLPRVSRSPQV